MTSNKFFFFECVLNYNEKEHYSQLPVICSIYNDLKRIIHRCNHKCNMIVATSLEKCIANLLLQQSK